MSAQQFSRVRANGAGMTSTLPKFGLFREDLAAGMRGCYCVFLGVAFIPFGLYLYRILDKPFHWVGIAMICFGAVSLAGGATVYRIVREHQKKQWVLHGFAAEGSQLRHGQFRAVTSPADSGKDWQRRRVDRFEAIRADVADTTDRPRPTLIVSAAIKNKNTCALRGIALQVGDRRVVDLNDDKALLWMLSDDLLTVVRSGVGIDSRTVADDLERLAKANHALGPAAFNVHLVFEFQGTVGRVPEMVAFGVLPQMIVAGVFDAVAYHRARKAIFEGNLVDPETGGRILTIAEEHGWELKVLYDSVPNHAGEKSDGR